MILGMKLFRCYDKHRNPIELKHFNVTNAPYAPHIDTYAMGFCPKTGLATFRLILQALFHVQFAFPLDFILIMKMIIK